MILLANVRDVKNLDCEVWYIVRSLGNLKLDEMHKHVPELSPNNRLFFQYLNAKDMGAWNRGWFDTNYVPAFIRQMKHDENAQAKLQELVSKSETEDIALVCFCDDEAKDEISEDCYLAAEMEYDAASGSRLDNRVVYFTAGDYGKYGEHAYQHGRHYFCYE